MSLSCLILCQTNLHFVVIDFCKETPEPFPLPDGVSVVKASAGWAHCVVVTGTPDNF